MILFIILSIIILLALLFIYSACVVAAISDDKMGIR
jgi:hypothetical protein